MAALKCDLCGGKIVGKAGGLFECTDCGMAYDAEWAKDKLSVQTEKPVARQEAQPVEVKVTSLASAESLLQRGKMALQDQGWTVAEGYFNQVLDIDPSFAEAYLGLAMAVHNYANYEEVENAYYEEETGLTDSSFLEDTNFNRAKENAAGQLREQFQKWETRAARLKARADQARSAKIQEMREARLRLGDVANHISAGLACFGIQADGSVLAVQGVPFDGAKATAGWTDVKAIAVGSGFVLGLTNDGKVRMVGNPGNVYTGNWTNITAISTGGLHAVGLRADGTVVASGLNDKGQCNVSGWRNIVAVSAGGWHTVGVKDDGTVVATGQVTSYHQVELVNHGMGVLDLHVGNWKDVVDVATGAYFTVGLCADGTVIPVGNFVRPEYVLDLCEWKDIVKISACSGTIVGLKANGSVVATGYNLQGECNVNSWRDIVAISAGDGRTLGLRKDGVVEIATDKDAVKTAVRGWKLFNSFETLEEEKKEAAPKANWKRNGLCQHCGNSFKGLFTKTCSNCGKPKDY